MSGNETPLVCSCDVGYLGTGAWDRVAQSYFTQVTDGRHVFVGA